MPKQIIVNLPVADLARSKEFFSGLGFTFNPQFSSEGAAQMVIAPDSIHVMLMTEPLFQSLIDKPVLSAKNGNQAILCVSCDSRAELDNMIASAVAAGGRTPHPPEDEGFMVHQGFEDLDGHLWNLMWFAPTA